MSETIHKYVFHDTSITFGVTFNIHKDAKVLSVLNQRDSIVLYAMCNTSKEIEQRSFKVYGTGWPCDAKSENYIGTVIVEPYVWHVFEDKQ
jgi:hypothetical protein